MSQPRSDPGSATPGTGFHDLHAGSVAPVALGVHLGKPGPAEADGSSHSDTVATKRRQFMTFWWRRPEAHRLVKPLRAGSDEVGR